MTNTGKVGVLIALVGFGLLLTGGLGAIVGSANPNFINALAQAIAKAEGANPRINNPGDLTAGDVPEENRMGIFNSAGVVIIDTLENGQRFLRNKLTRILDGSSSVYSSSMTIADFALKYTGGDNSDAWANTVAQALGVSTDTTLADAQSAFGG